MVHDFFQTAGMYLCNKAIDPESSVGEISGVALKRLVEPRFMSEGSLNAKAYDGAAAEECGYDLGELLYKRYLERRKEWPNDVADQVERQISLNVIDRNWQKHIDTMSHLREGINLRSYAQTNPLQDYVNEGYELFRQMNEKVAVDTAFGLLNVQVVKKAPEEQKEQNKPVDVEASTK